MHIFFSHLFSSPKFSPLLPSTYLSPPTYHLPPPSYLPPTSPLLPTTYHLPPPSYPPPTNPSPPSLHRQSSRDVEQERASSRGAWREAWRGAWSSELGIGERLESEWDPRKHLTFFFSRLFCLFVCGAALHCSSTRYTTLVA